MLFIISDNGRSLMFGLVVDICLIMYYICLWRILDFIIVKIFDVGFGLCIGLVCWF